MKLYKFSPIKSEEDLNSVYEYIATQLIRLSKEVLGIALPTTTLKVFPHYPEEYNYLFKQVSKKGPAAAFNSQTSYYSQVKETISGQEIKYLGVRIVDPYRLHVGCGDYEVPNFSDFRKKYSKSSPFIRDFREDMLELWHPDFDVLGYVIQAE